MRNRILSSLLILALLPAFLLPSRALEVESDSSLGQSYLILQPESSISPIALPITSDSITLEDVIFPDPIYVAMSDTPTDVLVNNTTLNVPSPSLFTQSSTIVGEYERIYFPVSNQLAFTALYSRGWNGEYMRLSNLPSSVASPVQIVTNFSINSISPGYYSSISLRTYLSVFPTLCPATSFSTTMTQNRYVFRSSFSTLEIGYINSEGTFTLLSSTSASSASFNIDSTFQVGDYVSSFVIIFSGLYDSSFGTLTNFTSDQAMIFVHRISLSPDWSSSFDPAPSEYSLLYRIWQTVVEILAYLGNPIHGTLQSILNAIQAISGGIAAPSDVEAKASEAVGAMESARNDIDIMTDEIDGLTTRPPPDEIMPSLAPDVYNPSDPAAQASMAVVGEIMGHPAILPLLLSVFALAFIRYVIFGKAE